MFVSVVVWLAFMLLLLATVGSFGVGVPELVIWIAIVAAGLFVLVRRHRAEERPTSP